MKSSITLLVFTTLVLFFFSACKKSNMSTGSYTQPFTNNDSVQFFYPPKDIYNIPGLIQFSSIVIDNKNNKWMSNNSGIFRFDGTNWTYFNSKNMPIDPLQYQSLGLLCDSKGTIYSILTPFSGEPATTPVLVQYKDGSWTSFNIPFVFGAVRMDKSTDMLYFQSTGDTVYKFNRVGSFSNLSSYTPLYLGGDYGIIDFQVSHDSILAFFDQHFYGAKTDSAHFGFLICSGNGITKLFNYPDSSTDLWLDGIFSSDGKTIYMFGGATYWSNYTSSDNLNNVYTYSGNKWDSVALQFNTGYQWPNFMKYSNDGVLWISYGWSGMVSYKNQQFSFHDLSDSKPYSHIADFAFDSGNVKWLACWEGLIRYVVN